MVASVNPSTKFSVALTLNWKITLIGLLILPLLIYLGFWQLQRADEKRVLQADIEQQRSIPALPLSVLLQETPTPRFRQVTLQGRFDVERYWLLDNKVHQGKVGYQVIAAFLTDQGDTVLVNRGWVQAPVLRSQLPRVDFNSAPMALMGRLNQVSKNAMIEESKEAPESIDRWPKRIQQLDLDRSSDQLKLELVDWVVELAPDDPSALNVLWSDVNVSPDKHHGYAVQWFAMSFALVVALVFANTNLGSWFNHRSREAVAPLDIALETQNTNNKKGAPHER